MEIIKNKLAFALALTLAGGACYAAKQEKTSGIIDGARAFMDNMYETRNIGIANLALGAGLAWQQLSDKKNEKRHLHAAFTLGLASIPLMGHMIGYDELEETKKVPYKICTYGMLFGLLGAYIPALASFGTGFTFYEEPEKVIENAINAKFEIKPHPVLSMLTHLLLTPLKGLLWPTNSNIAKVMQT